MELRNTRNELSGLSISEALGVSVESSTVCKESYAFLLILNNQRSWLCCTGLARSSCLAHYQTLLGCGQKKSCLNQELSNCVSIVPKRSLFESAN
jgi:hypothetical protein